MRWTIILAISQMVVLFVLERLLSGLEFRDNRSVLVAAIVFSVAQIVSWPVIYWVSLKFHPLLFPLLSFGLSASLILILSDLVNDSGLAGIHVDDFGTALLVSILLAFGSTLVTGIASLNDDTAFNWFVVRPLAREHANVPRTSVPGILFLEIDGLALPILERAMAEGWMPNLARWKAEQNYVLTGWEPDLSSQTSASQAGILLGDNSDIPAFRWFDKPSGKLMVSSQLRTARQIEDRIGIENGLLRHGASRWNIFSGGASDSILTYSVAGSGLRSPSSGYIAYFLNPFTFPRVVGHFAGDVVRERWQAWRQVRKDVKPRIHRKWQYAFVRAATTTLMQEAGLFFLLSDMFRGLSSVYITLFAYDEVAHHSGIDREDAFQVLKLLDRMFGTLERARASAPRPYHLVILSDHGQSMGATFRQRTGRSLGELVTTLVDPERQVTVDERAAEDWGRLNVAVNDAVAAKGDTRSTRLIRRMLHSQMTEDQLDLEPPDLERDADIEQSATTSDVVVLASGNLGLISFPKWPGRMTYEEIVDNYPSLVPGLLSEEWIGFLMMKSSAEGTIVVGRHGISYLDQAGADGTDPLAPYDVNAAKHLMRTSGFSNAPDILVMSAYDATTGEVAAFEELVGSHGGLGGPQTRPFVFHPAELPVDGNPIVGAAHLHRVLLSWTPSESVDA